MVIKSGKGPYNFVNFNKRVADITEFHPNPQPWPADFLSWPAAGLAPRINQVMFTTSPGGDSDQLCFTQEERTVETSSDDSTSHKQNQQRKELNLVD